jgi:hypothetical protein
MTNPNLVKMTVSLTVTEGQALALQAMFELWNDAARRRGGLDVTLHCDPAFEPNCEVLCEPPVRVPTGSDRARALLEYGPSSFKLRASVDALDPAGS